MTCIKSLVEFMLADRWDVDHRFWLILVVGIHYVRKGISQLRRELVILELLTLILEYR